MFHKKSIYRQKYTFFERVVPSYICHIGQSRHCAALQYAYFYLSRNTLTLLHIIVS